VGAGAAGEAGTGGGSGGGGSGSGCAAAWVSNAAYTSGDEVSYNGDNWTASQWNYDEVPGGASGAWNNEGSC
jgi:chitinase